MEEEAEPTLPPYTPRYRRGDVPEREAVARDLFLDEIARVKRELADPTGRNIWIYNTRWHDPSDVIHEELRGIPPGGACVIDDPMLTGLREALASGRRVIVSCLHPPPGNGSDYFIFHYMPPIPLWPGPPVTEMGYLVGNP